MLKTRTMLGVSLAIVGMFSGCSSTPKMTEEGPPGSPFITVFPTAPPPRQEETNAPAPPTPVITNVPPTLLPEPAPRVPILVPATPLPTWLSTDQWSQSTGWGKPERLRQLPTWTYALKSPSGSLEITAGNRTATWNGVNLELGFTPRMTNGQAYLHALDASKTLGPLLQSPALLSRTNRSIVIDPGHGGENYGAKSVVSTQCEKDYVLDWAFRIRRLLIAKGWRVYLTRTNDVDIPLLERVAYAEKVQADLFISLHFNSTDQPQGGAEQGGLETYCLTPVGMPSTLTRRYDDEINLYLPNNAFDADNYALAARLHRALVQTTGRRDRGLRRARFMGVLRTQNRPAILLEGGYLTYAPEARLIGQAEYRQRLAQAVADALSEPAK